jgi:hypothetical protein
MRATIRSLNIIGLFTLDYLPEVPVVPRRAVATHPAQPGKDQRPRCGHPDRMVRPFHAADGGHR